ncbi:MAG: NAD-dependent epimerase/dehydratase family protein [Candidatus Lokiarchaeota archaeon]|nr:NAD-dependent epimerase/dehydratase family protein [Candidatus Lokiarchaeota archaeon]MBD3199644.1 NAD-dependent epimerase/dehydratase family protein [Candidatus Lokiarchaeota archaeon]
MNSHIKSDSNMKYALVDGALGHTGSFLVKHLVKNGWYVVATDLKPSSRKRVMTKERLFHTDLKTLDCRDWDNVKFLYSDLIDKKSLVKVFKSLKSTNNRNRFDIVFHPASLYDYGASYELLHEVNYNGLRNLLDVMIDHSEKINTKIPRFIHLSTCGVYGEPIYQKDKHGFIYPADEKTPYNPPNNYSQTKVEQEKLIIEYSKKNPDLNYTILRPAPIYGPYQTYGMFHIFYSAYIMGHFILPKIFPKKKKLMMPMIHVEDLVDSAIYLAEDDRSIGEVYNIINNSPLQESFLEFIYNELDTTFSVWPMHWSLFKIFAKFNYILAKYAAKKAKKKGIRPKFDLPMVKYLTHQYYFSNQKIKQLGFKFKYDDFKKGVYETILWYKNHGWLPALEHRLPEYINTTAKPGKTYKSEYRTPMKGGEIF